MATYNVTWEIQIDASNPEEAARMALEIQRDPESVATVFKVWDEKGDDHTIDISALEE